MMAQYTPKVIQMMRENNAGNTVVVPGEKEEKAYVSPSVLTPDATNYGQTTSWLTKFKNALPGQPNQTVPDPTPDDNLEYKKIDPNEQEQTLAANDPVREASETSEKNGWNVKCSIVHATYTLPEWGHRKYPAYSYRVETFDAYSIGQNSLVKRYVQYPISQIPLIPLPSFVTARAGYFRTLIGGGVDQQTVVDMYSLYATDLVYMVPRSRKAYAYDPESKREFCFLMDYLHAEADGSLTCFPGAVWYRDGEEMDKIYGKKVHEKNMFWYFDPEGKGSFSVSGEAAQRIVGALAGLLDITFDSLFILLLCATFPLTEAVTATIDYKVIPDLISSQWSTIKEDAQTIGNFATGGSEAPNIEELEKKAGQVTKFPKKGDPLPDIVNAEKYSPLVMNCDKWYVWDTMLPPAVASIDKWKLDSPHSKTDFKGAVCSSRKRGDDEPEFCKVFGKPKGTFLCLYQYRGLIYVQYLAGAKRQP